MDIELITQPLRRSVAAVALIRRVHEGQIKLSGAVESKVGSAALRFRPQAARGDLQGVHGP